MMDFSNSDQAEKSSSETFPDSSISGGSPENNGIVGEPLVHPRVGDEYQVEIPPLLSVSEFFQLMVNSADPSNRFISGLPVPVMWVRTQTNRIKTEKPYDPHEVHTNEFVGAGNFGNKWNPSDMKNLNVQVNAANLVPGQESEIWTDFEVDCFVLGLYMLGKNLLQVTRFVGSKGMGQTLTYFYGRFYASAAHSRWSEGRKMSSRKCAIGDRFFTGYRQQELFSRLFTRLSEESRLRILEVSRAFSDGSSSLDEYVFMLKSVVGIRALVDAVGIGKGKNDLTTLIFDISKNNQNSAPRPEIPLGKVWSTLTRAEIVKYITGDFRVSKSRSLDLFWEAVWPRLLARGWHSELPEADAYKGSNHLVFLIPGIMKFSRSELSKGDHYFDSVTDVLTKVASEPELLNLEADENETNPSCSNGESNEWSTKVKSDADQDSSGHERHHYLQPRVSLGLSAFPNFTVVDSSLANEDTPNEAREVRCLPVELMSKNIPSVPVNHNPMHHKSRSTKHQLRRCVKDGVSSCVSPVTNRRRLSSYVDRDVPHVLSLLAKRKTALRVVGPKLSRTGVQSTSENVSVADNHTVNKNVQDSSSGTHACFNTFRENEKSSVSQEVIDLNLPPQVSFEPESYVNVVILEKEESNFGQTSDSVVPTCSDIEKSNPSAAEEQKKSEDAVCCSNNMDTIDPSDNMEEQVSSSSEHPSNKAVASDQQPRRLSTRNRPATTKLLEAFESGFLSPVRPYKKRSTPLALEQESKRPRQPRNISPLEMRFSEETRNSNPDMVGLSSIGFIPKGNKK